MTELMQSVQQPPASEKLDLVQALWDDIAQTCESFPVSEDIQTELLRRAAWHQGNPGHGQSLDKIDLKLGGFQL